MLPTNRDNKSWNEINNQFLKGGFNWFNNKNPDHNNWYYLYYINGNSEYPGINNQKYHCEILSRRKKFNKVTNWLKHIEKFEEVREHINKQNKCGEKEVLENLNKATICSH